MTMNIKEIQESAQRFSESVKEIEDFFLSDFKHINYFTENEVNEIKYVLLSSKGVIIGFISDTEYELSIPWEDFLTYVYKVHCEY